MNGVSGLSVERFPAYRRGWISSDLSGYLWKMYFVSSTWREYLLFLQDFWSEKSQQKKNSPLPQLLTKWKDIRDHVYSVGMCCQAHAVPVWIVFSVLQTPCLSKRVWRSALKIRKDMLEFPKLSASWLLPVWLQNMCINALLWMTLHSHSPSPQSSPELRGSAPCHNELEAGCMWRMLLCRLIQNLSLFYTAEVSTRVNSVNKDMVMLISPNKSRKTRRKLWNSAGQNMWYSMHSKVTIWFIEDM